MLGFYSRAIALGFPSHTVLFFSVAILNISFSMLLKGFPVDFIIRVNTFFNIVLLLLFIERRLLNFPFRLW